MGASYPQGAVDVVDAAGAQGAVQALARASELAVDLEADAMHAFRARLCFLQVGSDEAVFLFDTLQPGVEPGVLGPLMADAQRTKYLHAAMGDLPYLAEAGVRVQGLFDTHRAATLLGWPKVGLADLVRELLGVELPKEHQHSDFSLRPLPPGMREYIADDVRYLCEVGRRVREACRAADILEEVELDCQRMAEEASARPEVGADFKPRLPRTGLSAEKQGLAHAVARGLHQLRLKWAEAEDVPMGRVLSNQAIADMAVKLPGSTRELSKVMGVRGAFVRAHGEEVLALVRETVAQAQRGELPREAEPAAQRDPQRRKREEALKAWRSEKAAARKVTPSVVLPNALFDALVARPPSDLEELRELRFFGEKRLQLYGAELVELLGRFPSS